ncbi:MAG: ATP-binding cassette domain-containing protein, partial [Chitinophagia bacterium]
FSGDDVDKKIRVLSGGEKARVALAKTIISKSNFLMLDEPTNHLDMHSVDLLAEALDKYEGSLILVSHDRYFISKTANKIWEIMDGKIVEFKGGYTEWVEWKERMASKEQGMPAKAGKPAEKAGTGDKGRGTRDEGQGTRDEKFLPERKEQGTPIDKEKQKEKKRIQRLFDEAEMKINKLKTEKAAAEAALADPLIYSDRTKFNEAEKKYQHIQAELTKSEPEYEKLFEQLMGIE